MKTFSLFLSLALILASCQGSDHQAEKSRKKDAQESLDELSKSIEEMVEGNGAKTVHYTELQELLPKKLDRHRRTDLEGNTSGILGVRISTAQAVYEKGDSEVEISIVDAGSLGVIMSMADWVEAEFDESDRNGFKRTGTFEGYRCFEQYRKKGNSEMAVIVANRFLVVASGGVDDFDDLRDMVSDMKLKRLERMDAVEID